MLSEEGPFSSTSTDEQKQKRKELADNLMLFVNEAFSKKTDEGKIKVPKSTDEADAGKIEAPTIFTDYQIGSAALTDCYRNYYKNKKKVYSLAVIFILHNCTSDNGKTHLAMSLGMAAIDVGYSVCFISMDRLIYALKTKNISSLLSFPSLIITHISLTLFIPINLLKGEPSSVIAIVE